jgi:hypothetical protein
MSRKSRQPSAVAPHRRRPRARPAPPDYMPRCRKRAPDAPLNTDLCLDWYRRGQPLVRIRTRRRRPRQPICTA